MELTSCANTFKILQIQQTGKSQLRMFHLSGQHVLYINELKDFAESKVWALGKSNTNSGQSSLAFICPLNFRNKAFCSAFSFHPFAPCCYVPHCPLHSLNCHALDSANLLSFKVRPLYVAANFRAQSVRLWRIWTLFIFLTKFWTYLSWSSRCNRSCS